MPPTRPHSSSQAERDELESSRVETARRQREDLLAAKAAASRELSQVPLDSLGLWGFPC